MSKEQPIHETPTQHTGLKITQPSDSAAGIPAVARVAVHAGRYMKAGEAISTSLKLNQKDGFDCPGCAWPDPDDERSSIAEYCENGMKAVAEEAQKKTIGQAFFAEHSIQQLGQWSDFQLGKAGRLAEPLYKAVNANHYTPISWEGAYRLLANELKALPDPDRAVFYTSGRTSNEAAFMYQLMVRAYGTNNMPDCSNMCHEASGTGLKNTIGIGKGTVTLEDLHTSELILVMGQNPGTNHPRMLSALEKCKENGGKVIAVNPLEETGLIRFVNPQRPGKLLSRGTPIADLHLPVRLNGDIALLKAIMLRLWHEDREQGGYLLDWDFIGKETTGIEALVNDLRQQDFTTLAEAAGVARADILTAVDMIKRANRIIICWAMGITQQENGTETVQEIVNLLLLKGSIGRQGAGVCPVRGHSNVQGNRTVGIWEAPSSQLLDGIQQTFGFEPTRKHGYSTVAAIKAMHEKKVDFFMSMGGNFLSAAPDTAYTATAMRKVKTVVSVSTKLNRTHLVAGQQAIILPTLGRTELDEQDQGEQFITVENSMGIVHRSKGLLPPRSEQLRSEPRIVGELAATLLGDTHPAPWREWYGNYDLVRNAIAATLPAFANYNEKVRQDAGFYLENKPRLGQFPTPDGKAHFTVNKVPQNTLQAEEYELMTMRSHDQYNTTIYGLNDHYRGVKNERRVIFMHPADMAERGWKTKQAVNIINERDGILREAKNFLLVPYQLPRRTLGAYFPEANQVVPISSFDPKSKTPGSKRVVVRLEASK